jgi:dCTP deaminase
MILTGTAIGKAVGDGTIHIDPFDPSCLSPNSYDFHLSDRICWYVDDLLDCRRENRAEHATIPPEGMVLRPDRIYLAATAETMGSRSFVPIIRARSSTARLGLFVHVTADLIDIGSINAWTLQLHAVQPVRIYSGMRIGQVTFWTTTGDIELYDGKYGQLEAPVPSLIHQDATSAAGAGR